MQLRKAERCIALTLAVIFSANVWAQAGASASEKKIFDLANHERRAAGVPALRWSNALANAARAHAKEMARRQEVSHRLPGEAALPARAARTGAHFSWLSENVVQARSATAAHEQFVHSQAHRANLLDRDMNTIGVGVVERGGQLWVVQDFAQGK